MVPHHTNPPKRCSLTGSRTRGSRHLYVCNQMEVLQPTFFGWNCRVPSRGTNINTLTMTDHKLGNTGEILTQVIGWTYTVCWTLSFYPQFISNFRRKSVVGLSFDYCFINVLGFLCYCAYDVPMLFSPYLRAEYASHNGGKLPLVAVNDVFFGLHALVLTILTASQLFIYERGNQKVSKIMIFILTSMVLSILGYGIAVAVKRDMGTVYNYVYFLSYVKLVITLIKYVPQAWSNFRRKSTAGWSIWQCFLDLTGGVLSITQLLFDGWRLDDWEGVKSNRLKFGLGGVSIFFDIIFIVQHFALYRNRQPLGYDRIGSVQDGRTSDLENERSSLLDDEKYPEYSKRHDNRRNSADLVD
ncbi:hypothetical protein PROFUN_02907 [Planoprotostelium fungivorum]|uniref:Cystinosin n=1 Tax=Planoprotostelium fungivorum TaxID=1890364 RepID=A0A2P6NSB0_9EUKA|nr:hypothetical protein PROFUN_02907 [Planoprotostelium fungivorum]